MPEKAPTWTGRRPQTGLRGRWQCQVGAESTEKAHTWTGQRTQAADGAAGQVAVPGGSEIDGKGSHLDGAAAADGAAGRRAQAADTDADAGRWTRGAGRRTEPALMWTNPDSQICPGIGPEADRSPIPRYGLM